MKKFLVVYYAPAGMMEQAAKATPEEAKKGMEGWMVWAQQCGEKLLDMGTPLGNGQQVNSAGATPSSKDVTGWSMLQADSMEEAVEMLKDHPHSKWGADCSVEVYECLPLPGM